MAKLSLNNITAGFASTAVLNANFDAIETAIENTVSRDGTTPNQMTSDLDMNSNGIINLSSLDVDSLSINGVNVTPTGTIATEIPSQIGHANKFLQTNGTVVSWQEPEASEISYTPAGTGVVVATVQSKLRESVSVKDFGAVGDGVTDDRPAFVLANTNGGHLHIPAPAISYTFSSPLLLDNVSVEVDPNVTWAALTDNGNLTFYKGRVTGGPNGCGIHRLSDRVFIGEAANKYAGNSTSSDGGDSWFNTTDYPGYLGINAHLLVTNSSGGSSISAPYGVTAALLTSNAGQGVIGFASASITDNSNAAWGFIAESQRDGSGACYGIEVAAKNTYNNPSITPNAQTSGVFGVWLAGGGDDAFGGASTYPSTAGIVILKNKNTWNTGICFQKDSLTAGEAISMSAEGVGGAHALNWYNAAGNINFSIRSNTADTTSWRLERTGNGIDIVASGKTIFTVGTPGSAVNGIQVYGAATGAHPAVLVLGDDTNIDLRLVPKGTGVLRFGTHTGGGDVACNGYITIKDSAGTTRKLMTTA